jgi:ATP-dependent protease HslVU (ClpYQ) peptidase subunit
MSIIVVVKKADKVVIAADTLYLYGNTKVHQNYLRKRSKIHQFKNSFIGIVGASAHDNVFAHLIEKHSAKISFATVQEIYDSYLKIHTILKEKYFINTSEGSDSETYESSQIDALIANPNGIFGMYSWREVYEFEKFWALGSGKDYALGALFANYDLMDNPEQLAETAVQAACEFDDGCGLPLTTHSIQLVETKHARRTKISRQNQK